MIKTNLYLVETQKKFNTIKEVYDYYKPCFVKHYLQNGEIKIKGYNYGYEE